MKFSKTIYETIFAKFYNQFIEKSTIISKLNITIVASEFQKFKKDKTVMDTVSSNTTSFESVKKRIETIDKLEIFSIDK